MSNDGSVPETGRPLCYGEQQSFSVEVRYQATMKYGLVKSVRGELQPSAAITYTIFQDGGSFNFDNYDQSSTVHERALETVGLRDIEWLGRSCPRNGTV